MKKMRDQISNYELVHFKFHLNLLFKITGG